MHAMSSMIQCLYSYQLPHRAPVYVEQVLEQPIEVSTHDLSDQSDSDSEPEGSPAVAAAVSNAEREDTLNETAEPQFARELLVFYLFGKILPRHDHLRNESLKRRLSEVKQLYCNIPSILHFNYSTVALDQIGVTASQPLPKDTVLGPYSGKQLADDILSKGKHNEYLWEVHDQTGVSSFIDGTDPKYGNWMSLIQCARSREEQNLKLTQKMTSRGVQLYYVAIKHIDYGQELLVWYDNEQVRLYFGLPIALKDTTDSSDEITTHFDTSHSTRDGNEAESKMVELTVQQTQTDTNAGSTCTDDSGVFSGDQETDSVGMQTVKIPRGSSPEEEFDTPQPPLLRPLTNVVPDDVLFVQEPPTIPIRPTPQLPTYTYIQAPIAPPQYGYIGVRDNSYSPQLSPRRLNAQTWLGKQRSRSRSPVITKPGENTGESSDTWRVSGSPKNQLLYGMFTRSEDGSRWRCTRCERHFNSQGSLRAHARIHTGERPYKCKFCSRTFCQASTLRSHERLHTGEKPYKCGVCGRAFTQSAGLRSHLKTHMGGTRFE